MDSGASEIYFAPDVTIANLDPSVPPFHVDTTTGSVERYRGTSELDLSRLPTYIPKLVQVMPSFDHTLVGIGSFYDDDCTVTFDKDAVTIYDPPGCPIITDCRESEGARL